MKAPELRGERCEDEALGAGFEAPTIEDAFQVVQEAGGLAVDARHPAGAALYPRQARKLLEVLWRAPLTGLNVGPRRALSWLLGEVAEGEEAVPYEEVRWRAERFGALVMVRPDGYVVTALRGTPLQRQGPLRLEEGQWRVGNLTVGDFYYSRGGVFYPVTEALRCSLEASPWGELGLGRDWLNAALDGAQQATAEMVVTLGECVVHPIRSVEGLAQLPTAVARLIASSPEYFARYGAMSQEDQIREAARLSTHVLTLVGGGQAAGAGRLGGLGAEVVLTARGELVLSRTAVGVGAVGLDAGAVAVLMGTGRGAGHAGGGGGSGPGPTRSAEARGPGKWVQKKRTTDSRRAQEYQEQVTGKPSWWVYVIGEVEYDGYRAKELLEAKGPGYCAFFNPDGTPKYWYVQSGKYDQMIEQAGRQSVLAARLGLPVAWHVAEANVAGFLRPIFRARGWKNITVEHTPPRR